MDVFIALMSDDFHDSDWTDQEAGVAFGRGILIIPIKIGKDPYGFIGKYQALSGTWENVQKMAKEIYEIIVNHAATKEKVKRAIITAFKKSSCYDESKYYVSEVLANIENLTTTDIDEVISAFNENCQINGCYAAKHNLPSLLYKWTGNLYDVMDHKLVKRKQQTESIANDEIPF